MTWELILASGVGILLVIFGVISTFFFQRREAHRNQQQIKEIHNRIRVEQTNLIKRNLARAHTKICIICKTDSFNRNGIEYCPKCGHLLSIK